MVSTSQKGDLVGFSFGQYNIASLFLSMVCLVWLFRIFYGDSGLGKLGPGRGD